jgi:hypothetical protein
MLATLRQAWADAWCAITGHVYPDKLQSCCGRCRRPDLFLRWILPYSPDANLPERMNRGRSGLVEPLKDLILRNRLARLVAERAEERWARRLEWKQ